MSNILYQNNTDKELVSLLKAKYLSGKELIQVITKYKKCKNTVEKEKLREIIFNNNIRMIRKQASHFAKNSPVDIEDLFGAGTVGFFEGLERFKLEKKVMFSTYIKFWIDKSIYECLHQQNILHIPRGDFSSRREQIQPFLNGSLLYLDAPVTTDGDSSDWNDLIPDTRSSNFDSEYFNKKKKEWAMRLINKTLNKREKFVIRSKYMEGKSNLETGKLLGVVGQTVANIEDLAIAKLQKIIKRRISKRGIRYKKRSSKISEALKQASRNNLARINSDPEIIRKRANSYRGHIMTEEQKLRMSEARRNPSLETRLKNSKACQKFSIEIANKLKNILLSGKSMAEASKALQISTGWINKAINGRVLYLSHVGFTFTQNEIKKIREFETINRSKNTKERRAKLKDKAKEILKMSDHVGEITKNTSGGLIKRIFGFMK